MPESLAILQPEWDLPPTIRAAVTTRVGGVSVQGFASLNLAGHVGDVAAHVTENRRRLQKTLSLPAQPLWLNQVHGVAVAKVGYDLEGATADAAVSTLPGLAAAVLTADCLPVLFYGQRATGTPVVAAAHAGWRGLAAGILEQTLNKMACPPARVSCWLGPAIGPAEFQVGAEVKARFVAEQPEAEQAFVADTEAGGSKYLANLYQLARLRLRRAGVSEVAGGDFCTVSDQRFFSYRQSGRDPAGVPVPCGRFASLIWID